MHIDYNYNWKKHSVTWAFDSLYAIGYTLEASLSLQPGCLQLWKTWKTQGIF